MATKIEIPKQKKYYDVRMETLCPCLITYRVYAEDEHDAIIQIKGKQPTNVRPNVALKRDIKATVYDAGSSFIRLVKSFRF